MLDKIKEFLESEDIVFNIHNSNSNWVFSYFFRGFMITIRRSFVIEISETSISSYKEFKEYKKEHDKRSYNFKKVEEHIKKLNKILEEK